MCEDPHSLVIENTPLYHRYSSWCGKRNGNIMLRLTHIIISVYSNAYNLGVLFSAYPL